MKLLFTMIAVLMHVAVLTAASPHLNLYSGKPQEFTVSKLTPQTIYAWKLSTTHGRTLGVSQVKTDDNGWAKLSIECPAIEPGSTVKAVIKLEAAGDTKTYNITFHSKKIFAQLTTALNKKGVYASSDKLEKFMEQTGIKLKESVKAKICFLEDETEETINKLISNGKTVIYFTDGENQLSPIPSNLQNINLILFDDPTIKKAMSFEMTEGTLQVDYLDRVSIINIKYSSGRLVIIAPQWRKTMYKMPELWLKLINIIKKDVEK